MMEVINDIQPAVISVKHQECEEIIKKPKADDVVQFDNSSKSNEVLDNLNKLRQNKQFCDVVLHVSSEVDVHEIYAHRAVVASVSPYLFELFNQRAKSSVQNQCKLSGEYDIDVFEQLIDYAYTSKMEIPKDKMKAMYLTAAKLKVAPVAKHCGKYLVNNLTSENALGIRAILFQSMDQALISHVDGYIRQNIETVLKSKELSTLPHIQVELIQHTSAEMDSTNERHLFEMVLDWMRDSATDNLVDTEGFTEKVHMLYLNRDRTLHDCNDIEKGDVKDSELVQDYKRLSKKLNQPAGNNKAAPKRNPVSNTPVKPKQFLYTRSDSSASSSSEDESDNDYHIVATAAIGAHSTMGLAIICSRMILLSIVRRLNLHNEEKDSSPSSPVNGACTSPNGQQPTMTTLQAMTFPRCAMGTCDFHGKLLVCGGYDRGECLKSVELLDMSENRWSCIADMTTPRGRMSVACNGGRIYAVGGSDGTKELCSAEVYNPESEKWEALPPLEIARSHAGVCCLNDKIYIIGGWNGQRGMVRVDVFDPESKTWSEVAPLTVGRSQAGITVLNGYIYAVGGCETWNCTPSVERYDLESNEWTQVTPMQQARRGCGVATYKGKIYAIGGHDGSHSLCTVEIFDPITNSWSAGPSLTTCRANVGVVVVKDRLFAVGGFNGKTFLNTVEFLDSCEEDEWTAFVPRIVSRDCSRESSSGISGC